MRPTPEGKKQRVLNSWVDGKVYRSIEQATGVSLGNISEIIEEKRSEMPDLDELRDLNLDLKREGTSVRTARKGAQLIGKLRELDIPDEDLVQVVSLLHGFGKEAKGILSKAQELGRIELESGLGYREVVLDYSKKREIVSKMDSQVEDLRNQYGELNDSIRQPKALRALQDKLGEFNIPPSKLDRFVEISKQLDSMGFTPLVASALALELQKYGIGPSTAVKELALALKRFGDLQVIEKKAKELEHDINMSQITLRRKDEEIGAVKEVVEETYRKMEAENRRIEAEGRAAEATRRAAHANTLAEIQEKERKAKNDLRVLEESIASTDRVQKILNEAYSLTHIEIKKEMEKVENAFNTFEPGVVMTNVLSGHGKALSKKELVIVVLFLKNLETIASSSREWPDHGKLIGEIRSLRERLFTISRIDR